MPTPTNPESSSAPDVAIVGANSLPRAWLRGAVAGLLTIPFSIIAAYCYLRWASAMDQREMLALGMPAEMLNEVPKMVGIGDLTAFACWSFGLPIMMLLFVAWWAKRTAASSALIASLYLLAVPLLAFAWTIVVATWMGPWFGAFSFPVFPCWAVGATVAAILSLVVRPQRVVRHLKGQRLKSSN